MDGAESWPPPGYVTAPARVPGRGLTVDDVAPLIPKEIG